jgi:hypothetical protein
LDCLLNWPNENTIAPLFWTINYCLFPEDLANVLLPPIPQRVLFVAVQVEGDTQNEAHRLLENYLKTESIVCNFIESIVEVASLAPLGLDGFQIVTNEKGVFAFVNDKELDVVEEVGILERMRSLLAKFVKLSDVDEVIRRLPPRMESIHFVSEVLNRFTSLTADFSKSLLIFLSKLNDFRDIASDIAKQVIQMTVSLTTIPDCVVCSFLGTELPELSLLNRSSEHQPPTESFDRSELLQDLTSPIVPLRARGLFTLRKGVLTTGHPLRDESAVRSLFPSIDKQLQHPDSFVFLSAIQCLESIAVIFFFIWLLKHRQRNFLVMMNRFH